MREQLEQLLAAGRDNALLRFGLGNACLKEGDAAAAALHLQQATQQNPFHSAAWKLLGKALLALGRQARADAASTVTATLNTRAAGTRQLAAFTGAPLTISRGLTGQQVSINTSGSGPLYYTQELEGVPADGAAAVQRLLVQ